MEIYQPLIRSLAIRRGLQATDADDVTQEVLTRVARYIENWDSHAANSSFRGWLATITRNQTVQFFREDRRRPSTGIDSQINRKANEINESEFELERERQLFAWAARRTQSQFESNTWKAFWLTAVDDNSIPDVARRLQMSVGQVYVSRSRVMKALKSAVEQSEFDSGVDWNTT